MDYHEKLFPVIVKEKFGCGSHSVYIVNSENELNNIICYMEDPIIQEYIGDDSNEYTLTIFSDGEVVNYIAFRRTLGFGGMSRYVELVFDEKIEELAFTVADLFSLKGSINIQMRRANNNYYIFEINPRISSTMGFRLQLGFNDVEWWLNMLEGKSILQYSRPTQKVYGVKNVEEKLYYV